MLFGKGNNTIVLRKWFWHFVGIICHTILEAKSTGIQPWPDIFGETFPPCTAAPGNSRRHETQTLEISPSWPRLNAQGEVKTQFPVTNSGGTMDVEAALWAPQPSWSWITLVRHQQLAPPHLSCQEEHRTVPDIWIRLFPSPPVGFAAHRSPNTRWADIVSPAASLSGTECAWTDAEGKLIPSGESIAYWCWRR